MWKFDITQIKKAGTLPLFFLVLCVHSEWITSVGTSHVGYSHGGREREKNHIIPSTVDINYNSSSPVGRASKKGRDIKNMKRQCA